MEGEDLHHIGTRVLRYLKGLRRFTSTIFRGNCMRKYDILASVVATQAAHGMCVLVVSIYELCVFGDWNRCYFTSLVVS